MSDRPNILFFMMDQLSARWLECGAAPTPNFDRLRERGVTFTNAITSNPVCMPARATIATGLTTRGHGVLQNGYQLDARLPTFMQLLQRAGWHTGAFGKVHLRPHFAGVRPDYGPYGFDVTHITEDPRAGEWLDWVAEIYPEHYESALATIWAADIPDLRCYGPDGVDLSARIKQIRSRFDWGSDEFPHNDASHYTLPFPEPVSQSAWITAHASHFILRVPTDRPFYAHVSYVQPHSPFCPPARFMERVDPSKIPEPAGAEWIEDPLAPECFGPADGKRGRGAIPEDWREVRRYYFADVAHLDEQLGDVLSELDETGRLHETFVILLSDHGELLMDRGLWGKGEFHYDACLRVPLIIAGPGLGRGLVRDEIVQLEDVFPTVLEMAGLPLPEPPKMGPYLKHEPARCYGRSLLPLCRGEEATDWRTAAYAESYNNIDSCSPAHWARTVRTREYRYTMYPGGAGEQLFCLEDDPGEQRNLAGDPGHAEVRARMRDLLLDLVIRQDHPHPPRDLFAHGVH